MNQLEDVFKRRIRVSEERKKHLEENHPEMFGQGDKIQDTLAYPDQVRLSRTDSSVELFYKFYENTPVGKKYLCAVVKNLGDDLFLVTGYFTDKVKEGTVLYG